MHLHYAEWQVFILFCVWVILYWTYIPYLFSPYYQWILGCFHILANINSVGIKIEVSISFSVRDSVFFRPIPRSEITKLCGNSFFEELPYFFLRWLYQFAFSLTGAREFSSLHSHMCEVISHYSFDLWCWVSFHVPIGHLYLLFGGKKSLFSSSVHFFFFFL